MGEAITSPSMPAPLLALGFVCGLLFCWWFYRRTHSVALCFLAVAITVRVFANFFHAQTTGPFLAGQSLSSIVTAAALAFGLVLFGMRPFTRRSLMSLYLFIAVVIASVIANPDTSELTDAVLKYVYLVIVADVVLYLIDTRGMDVVARAILILLLPVFVLQLLSVGLGYSKATEMDGSISFIGGYVHEAAFSSLVLFALAVCMLLKPGKLLLLALPCCLLSLFLTNYRTGMIAAVPILFYFLCLLSVALLPSWRSRLAFVLVGTCGLLTLQLAYSIELPRFYDISLLLRDGSSFIKYPWQFTTADRQIMSGRLLLWSQYIYAYSQGDALQHLLGFGPDSWKLGFRKYAHNAYVSALYEQGIVGLLAYLGIFVHFVAQALRAHGLARVRGLCAIAAAWIYGLGTLPLANIEGIYFYAIAFALAARASIEPVRAAIPVRHSAVTA